MIPFSISPDPTSFSYYWKVKDEDENRIAADEDVKECFSKKEIMIVYEKIIIAPSCQIMNNIMVVDRKGFCHTIILIAKLLKEWKASAAVAKKSEDRSTVSKIMQCDLCESYFYQDNPKCTQCYDEFEIEKLNFYWKSWLDSLDDYWRKINESTVEFIKHAFHSFN